MSCLCYGCHETSGSQCHCSSLEALLYKNTVLQKQLQLVDFIQIEGKPVVCKAVNLHVDSVLRQQRSLISVMLPAADMYSDVSSGLRHLLNQPCLQNGHFCGAKSRPDGRCSQVYLHIMKQNAVLDQIAKPIWEN